MADSSDSSTAPDVQPWWTSFPHQPTPRVDTTFPTPFLPYPNAKRDREPQQQQQVQLKTRPSQRSPQPPAWGRTLYWGVSLDAHKLFFASVLDMVPEANDFFACFPAALRKDEFHATLLFAPPTADSEAPYMAVEGHSTLVEPAMLLVTSKLICLSVRFVEPGIAALCRNKCPHITLALAPGTKAYQSNSELELFQGGQLAGSDPHAVAVPIGDGFQIDGKVRRYFS